MKRISLLIVALAFVLAVAQPAPAQDLASSVVGVWKLTNFARKEVATGKTTATFGERPPGYAHYSQGGHFVVFWVGENRKANAKADPTDEERVELFKTMVSWGGKYKVESNKIVYQIELAWIQSWIGTSRTYQAEATGNKLTVTTPSFKSILDGQDIVVVTTWERVE